MVDNFINFNNFHKDEDEVNNFNHNDLKYTKPIKNKQLIFESPDKNFISSNKKDKLVFYSLYIIFLQINITTNSNLNQKIDEYLGYIKLIEKNMENYNRSTSNEKNLNKNINPKLELGDTSKNVLFKIFQLCMTIKL